MKSTKIDKQEIISLIKLIIVSFALPTCVFVYMMVFMELSQETENIIVEYYGYTILFVSAVYGIYTCSQDASMDKNNKKISNNTEDTTESKKPEILKDGRIVISSQEAISQWLGGSNHDVLLGKNNKKVSNNTEDTTESKKPEILKDGRIVISSQEAISQWLGGSNHKVAYVDKEKLQKNTIKEKSLNKSKILINIPNDDITESYVDPESYWGRLRERAFEKYGRVCNKCGSTYNLTVHHRVPIKLGGSNELYNLEILCNSCHSKVTGHALFDNNYTADSTGEYAKHKNKARKISESIKNNRQLQVSYKKFNGEKSKRSITPIRIFEDNGRVYVRAYCHLRTTERTFRLSRMNILSQ